MTRPHDVYPVFLTSTKDESYRSARKILRHMFAIYKPESIVDVGCGTGAWLKAAAECGVTQLTGIDGDWVESRYFQGTDIHFVRMSLENPVAFDQKYDLAISLEVIEHLRPARGKGFVRDLCGAADVIMFSGAVPGQEGMEHINERWQSHWVETFEQNGFRCFDAFRARIWHDEEIAPWYRQNIFLFVRAGREHLINRDQISNQPIFDVVHPEIYQGASMFKHLSGRTILRALPYVLARQWRRVVR